MPFFIKWPNKIPANTKTNQLTCLTDFTATIADLLNIKLDDHTAEDSYSVLPTLLNEESVERGPVIHHSSLGRFAVRHKEWVLAFCPFSGGWEDKKMKKEELNKMPRLQLYNIKGDVSQQKNVYDKHPDSDNLTYPRQFALNED